MNTKNPIKRYWLILWGGLMASFVLASLFDRTVLRAMHHPEFQQTDWYWLLRGVGDVRTWIALAVAFYLVERRWRRDTLIWAAPAAAGLLAELAKLLIGRERPVSAGIIQNDGFYVWKDGLFGGFADSSNLGLPSSHTAVAFGGAVALCLFLPRIWIIALPLACGCAITRLLTGAHFASDVVGGALVGLLTAILIGHFLLRSTRSSPLMPNPSSLMPSSP